MDFILISPCFLDLRNPTELTKLKNIECSSRKWPTKVSFSIASLHKNGFGLALIQHNSSLTILPWPQQGLVYIDLNLVIIPQLPPKIWAQKEPNISQKWAKISNYRLINHKNHYNKVFKPKIVHRKSITPFCRAPGHKQRAMWPSAYP
jgi:hypothetical protein